MDDEPKKDSRNGTLAYLLWRQWQQRLAVYGKTDAPTNHRDVIFRRFICSKQSQETFLIFHGIQWVTQTAQPDVQGAVKWWSWCAFWITHWSNTSRGWCCGRRIDWCMLRFHPKCSNGSCWRTNSGSFYSWWQSSTSNWSSSANHVPQPHVPCQPIFLHIIVVQSQRHPLHLWGRAWD